MESSNFIEAITVGVIRYFLFAGIPFLIFYVLFSKAFKNNQLQKNTGKRKDFLREIGFSLLATLVFIGISLPFIFGPLKPYTQVYHDISAYPMWWFVLSIIICLVLHDTYFYWMHRAIHHPKLYKRVHLLHHNSISPSPWASYSFSFLESILEGLIAPIVLIVLPLHPLAFITFTIISFIINVYGHLGFEIAPKWYRHSFLFEIVSSSTHHNLHHSKFRGNYGLYLRVWDRLMGTENPKYVEEYDRIQEKRFGKKPSVFKTLA